MKYEYWMACIRGISAKKKTLLREHMKNSRSGLLYRRNAVEQLTVLERERTKYNIAGKETGEP